MKVGRNRAQPHYEIDTDVMAFEPGTRGSFAQKICIGEKLGRSHYLPHD